ncbi:MAG: membrane protein insertase YidC [Clostridia bacterium]|nr:membrane protein insertase YidC [Clostridia bacterium]
MLGIFEIFATPLGYVLRWIYALVPTFFVAMLLFTLLMRLILFPLSIKNQKNQADRARLAPRLERIQKKYAADRNKMMQKQQELYEKEGVKMTPGCLPMIVQMLVLFSVIAVIYKPLTYVKMMPAEDINTCISVITDTLDKEKDKQLISRFSDSSYYRELYLVRYVEEGDGVNQLGDEMQAKLMEKGKTAEEAKALVGEFAEAGNQFSLLGISLLEVPSDYGIKPNWLWIIVLASGGTALLSSLLSMKYSKATMSKEQQQAAGCTNGMMYMMPLMSLIFSFSVPAGVAVYWTFSNVLAMAQTYVLNKMYNPAKIRAQAEAEYAERRRKKAEDKERLKQARLAEQAAWQQEENEKRLAAQGKGKKKSVATPATPAEQPETPVENTENSEEENPHE